MIFLMFKRVLQEADNSHQLKILLPPVIVQLIDFGAYAVRHSSNVKVIPLVHIEQFNQFRITNIFMISNRVCL